MTGSGAGKLFAANAFFGLIFSFSQPVTKSMPPTVVRPEDLSFVNSWDLTGDKVGRYLAPFMYAVTMNQGGFGMVAFLGTVGHLSCALLRTTVRVDEVDLLALTPRNVSSRRISSQLLGVFVQLRNGILSLQEDRTLALLILNTLVTNVFVYPLGSVLFPVLFKRAREDSTEAWSLCGRLLRSLCNLLGIHKKEAWQNYVALVNLGGVFGPFLSNLMVAWLESIAAGAPTYLAWFGVNLGLAGQILASVLLLAVLWRSLWLDTGLLVLSLFTCWVLILAVNNVFTVYFNSFQQQQLKREVRGRFIANIITIFTFGNSVGTLLFGWALDTGDAVEAVRGSMGLLLLSLAVRIGLMALLHRGGSRKAMEGHRAE